jgi:hypothetical protein
MLLERLGRGKGSLTSLACLIIHTRGSVLSSLSCVVVGLLLQRLPMRTTRHVCAQGIDVFERDVTVATPIFRSMEFYLAVSPPSALTFEGQVAFRTVTVSRSDAVVFKDIQALTELAAIAAFADSKVVLSH